MSTFKELLPKRIPEYLQADNALKIYLETAGELFDLYKKTITDFDYYDDYQNCPEQRLRDLASHFAFKFPTNLEESVKRDIIRDIVNIAQHNGTEKAFRWIFRLIGWDVEFMYPWVMNPEYYDPKITDSFGLDTYDEPQTPPFGTDVWNLDYRTFVFGREIVHANGTYFSGRRFYEDDDTFTKLEIIGEHYKVNKTRTPDKVIKTPYVFVKINEEDYNLFIQPYEAEDGTLYDYTDSEAYRLIENLINFFLYESFRPAQVRVVMLVTDQFINDSLTPVSEIEDIWESEPIIIDDEEEVNDSEQSQIDHTPIITDSGFIVGMPMHPDSKDAAWSVDTENYTTEYNPLTLDINAVTQVYFDSEISFDVSNYTPYLPAVGIDKFIFASPDFGDMNDPERLEHRKYKLTHRFIDLDFVAIEPEIESMTMELNCEDETYDILDEFEETKHYQSDIHLRNPSKIESDCFTDLDNTPEDVYFIGMGQNEGDKIISFNFVNKTTRVDQEINTIKYAFDPQILIKANRLLNDYTALSTDVKIVDYSQLITEAHRLMFSFGVNPNFDINMSITYLNQV